MEEIQDILEQLIDFDIIDFKCFDLLKEKLKNNEEFRNLIVEGINNGSIKKFPRNVLDEFNELNLRTPFEPIQIFIDGANLGACTTMSKLVSYVFPYCEICGGTVRYLIGTKNSDNGEHTWISYYGRIIDTTFMIEINENYKEQLGYNEENRYNPNIDPIYGAAKDNARDKRQNKKN